MRKLLILVLLSGCASLDPNAFRVTFQSDPPGASLYQGDQNMGRMPMALTYRATDYDLSVGRSTFMGASARWVSGATAQLPHVVLNHSNGKEQQYTFKRPNAPGLEADVAFAIQLQNAALAQQQIDAQRSAAALQYWQNQQQIQQQNQLNMLNQMNRSRTTNCTSRALGNTVYTDCY